MATRTQVYLTDQQRIRLAELARVTGLPMSQLVRAVIDSMLSAENDLEATFGSLRGIGDQVPSRSEWDHRG